MDKHSWTTFIPPFCTQLNAIYNTKLGIQSRQPVDRRKERSKWFVLLLYKDLAVSSIVCSLSFCPVSILVVPSKGSVTLVSYLFRGYCLIQLRCPYTVQNPPPRKLYFIAWSKQNAKTVDFMYCENRGDGNETIEYLQIPLYRQ